MSLSCHPWQQGSVPELDGSVGFSNKMAASRFGEPKLPGGLRHLRTCGDFPALLPVIYSKTHNGASARKILYNSSPHSTSISETNIGKKIKEAGLNALSIKNYS